MKSKFYTILLVFSIGTIIAQPTYNFSTKNQAYTELTNPTLVTNTLGTARYTINPGVNFEMFHQEFSFNGTSGLNIEAGFGAVTGLNNSMDTLFSVDGFFCNGLIARDNTTSISYELTTAGNEQLLKVQWKNATVQGGDPLQDYVNFQIWLYENGKTEVHFGPLALTSPPGSLYFQGNNGPGVGVFLSDPSLNIYESLFLNGQANNPTANYTAPFSGLSSAPTNGQAYVFEYTNTVSLPEQEAPGTIDIISVAGTKSVRLIAESTNTKEIEYTLRDMGGRIIQEGKADLSKEGLLNFEMVKAGNYLLEIISGGLAIREKVAIN